MERVGHRAHVLDVDAVDLLHLGDEQLDQAVVGQLDHELVDGPTAAPLEDVDADDVAPTAPMRLATAPSAPGRSGSHTRTM